MSKHLKGSCLCGAVNVTLSSKNNHIGACHCNMCRKWAGGPLMTIESDDVTFDAEENISVFASSEWAERGFCKHCGSNLFYKLNLNGQYFVPTGLFKDDKLVFDHQIFIDEKPAYYNFENKTHNMTGAEVFAQYAPKSN